MDALLQDLRYTFRILARSPGYTLAALITLALGIGANTTIFSVVNQVLLRPLPYTDPDRLVMLWGKNPALGSDFDLVSPADFADMDARNHVFEGMAASRDASYSLAGEGEPETITAYRFSHDFFELMGVAPALGRTFLPEEDRPGATHVVVLSDRLWRRRFHADPGALTRTIMLSDEPYTIIGVMPPAFRHPERAELWTPLALDPAATGDRNNRFLRVMARLAPGATLSDAAAQMQAIASSLEIEHPSTNAGQGVVLVPLRTMYVGDIQPALLALSGAVGFVLLIACANVSNLTLARASARRREIAIRLAVGAGRGRVTRQLLTESVLLSLLGGALGLLLAVWGSGLLVAIFPNNIANLSIPHVEEIPIDGRALLFGFAISLLSGVLSGLAPALSAGRSDLSRALKQTGEERGTGLGGTRLRGLLVVVEIALALVLLTGAGLMTRSFVRLQAGDLGLKPDHVLTTQVFLSRRKYADHEARRAFVTGVESRLEEIAGVRSVAAINFLPLSGFWDLTGYAIEGQARSAAADGPVADNRVVTPRYFQTMGIPFSQGRDFDTRDLAGGTQVAIVNETMARRHWPAGVPPGARLDLGDADHPSLWEIVGVVGDVKSFGLDAETHAEIFRPYAQVPFPLVAFTVKTESDPAAFAAAVRDAIWSVDKDQPVFNVLTMSQLAGESVTLRRVTMQLIGALAALAVILAAIGVFGVMSYAVIRRMREIGIRIALGARRQDVVRLVLRDGVALTLAGLGLGLAGALALTRFLSSLLYGIGPTDPLTFVAVVSILAVVALLASYIPAHRATKVDPMVALRSE